MPPSNQARIIHLIGDGCACAASLRSVTWWQRGVNAAMGVLYKERLTDARLRRLHPQVLQDLAGGG